MDRRELLLLLLMSSAILIWGCGGAVSPGELDGVLEDGWRAFSTGDFDFAVKQFDTVSRTSAASPQQAYSALLGLATTHHLRPNPELDEARACYDLLGELETGVAQRQRLLGLGLVDLAEGKTADGQAKLMALMKDYGDSMEADEATIHLADSLFSPNVDETGPGEFKLSSQGFVQRGIKVLEDRLKTHPHSLLAAAMHLMLADKYIERKRFDQALGHLMAADQAGISVVKTRGTVLWRIARIAEKELRDYEMAEEYYARYVEEFQRTELFYRALKSLERVRELKTTRGA